MRAGMTILSLFRVLTMVANDGGYSHFHQKIEVKDKIIESLQNALEVEEAGNAVKDQVIERFKVELAAEKTARAKAEVQITSQNETIKSLERELANEKAAKNKALKALELKTASEKTYTAETGAERRTRENVFKSYECPKMGVWSPHPKNDFFL